MPLSPPELEALLADLESDRVERKERATGTDRIGEAICAFANDLPNHKQSGVVFIGVRDDGSTLGLAIDDRMLLDLAHFRDDGRIQPFPVMSVAKHRVGGHDVVAIVVEPSASPPVRYRGRVWVRVGPRRAQATSAEETRLVEKRRWGALPFDRHPAPLARLDDLDLRLFTDEYLRAAVPSDILEENNRTSEHQLAAMRFLAQDGSPNVAAMLAFGKDPRAFLPGAYVQFARFDGADEMSPIKNQKELSGPLSYLLRQMEDLLSLNISVAADLTGEREARRADYPLAALRELSRNAVMHRSYEGTHAPIRVSWYSDRVEILSPGGLFGHVNEANFNQGATDYRNPTVAEAMKTLGYAQRFGIGLKVARDALAKNGNPPPEFAFTSDFLLATVRARS